MVLYKKYISVVAVLEAYEEFPEVFEPGIDFAVAEIGDDCDGMKMILLKQLEVGAPKQANQLKAEGRPPKIKAE